MLKKPVIGDCVEVALTLIDRTIGTLIEEGNSYYKIKVLNSDDFKYLKKDQILTLPKSSLIQVL